MIYELKLSKYYYDIMGHKMSLFLNDEQSEIFKEFFKCLNDQIDDLRHDVNSTWENCKNNACYNYIQIENPSLDHTEAKSIWDKNPSSVARGLLVSVIKEIEELSFIKSFIRNDKINMIID